MSASDDDVADIWRTSQKSGDENVEKLRIKISDLENQLGNLHKAFNGSADYIFLCEGRIRELENLMRLHHCNEGNAYNDSQSDTESKRKGDLDTSKLLKETEQSLISRDKMIADLEQKLRSKERQCKLNERKVLELNRELLTMKALADSSQHAWRLTPKSAGVVSTNKKIVNGLKSEIEALKAYLSSYQTRLEASKKAERVLALRVCTMEEQIDSQPIERHDDLEVKVLTLTETVRRLKIELRKANASTVSDVSADTEFKADKSFEITFVPDDSIMKSSFSILDNSYCRNSVSLMHPPTDGGRVIEGHDDSSGALVDSLEARLHAVEQERDVLLEFIQGDMQKSSQISAELEREREWRAQTEADFSIGRVYCLATDAAGKHPESPQIPDAAGKCDVAGVQHRVGSAPSTELSAVGDRLQGVGAEMERGKGKERSIIDVTTLEAKESIVRAVCLGCTIVATPSTAVAAPKLPWRGVSGPQRPREQDWQIERTSLLKELEAVRPLERALAELASDLRKAAHSRARWELQGEERSGPVPLRAATRDATGQYSAARSYSDMYKMSGGSSSSGGRALCPAPALISHPTIIHDQVKPPLPLPLPQPLFSTAPTSDRLTSLTRDHGPNSLSLKHGTWVSIPSIARLSLPLHERLKELVSDLHSSESACSELEGRLARTLEELKSVAQYRDDAAAVPMSAQPIQSAAGRESSGESSDCSSSESAAQAQVLLHQTIAALCAVPGGWEQFFDRNILEYLCTSSYQSQNISDELRSNISHSQVCSTWARPLDPLSARSSLIHPTQSLDLDSTSDALCRGGGVVTSKEGGYGRPVSSKSRGGFDLPIAPAHIRLPASSPPPPRMVPAIVSRAVAMVIAVSSELRDALQQLSAALSELLTVQEALGNAKAKGALLSARVDALVLRDGNSNEAFEHIEVALTGDLDRSNDLVHRQTLLVAKLTAKLDALKREQLQLSAQHFAVQQQGERDKQVLCGVLREYGLQASLTHLVPPLDALPLSLCAVTQHAAAVLSELVRLGVLGAAHREQQRQRLGLGQGLGCVPVDAQSLFSGGAGSLEGESDEGSCMTPDTEDSGSDSSPDDEAEEESGGRCSGSTSYSAYGLAGPGSPSLEGPSRDTSSRERGMRGLEALDSMSSDSSRRPSTHIMVEVERRERVEGTARGAHRVCAAVPATSLPLNVSLRPANQTSPSDNYALDRSRIKERGGRDRMEGGRLKDISAPHTLTASSSIASSSGLKSALSKQKRRTSGRSSSLSPSPDLTTTPHSKTLATRPHNPSQQLESRLKKAKLTFAALRADIMVNY